MNRRHFIRSTFSVIAGSTLLRAEEKSSLTRQILPSAKNEDASYWRMISSQFSFEPGLTYLNNGSLGPSPRIVRDATRAFRDSLDSFPSRYMWSDWWDDRERARGQCASLTGCDPDSLAITHNTCEGLNLVASSLQLEPGDEIIASDHEHHTGVVPLQHFQESRGVRLVRPTLPVLPESPGEIVDAITAAISSNTRLILLCHVVNTNGMIMPVREICEIAHKLDIRVLVDGAQAVGMIPVNLKELGCDYYAASGHKWMFGPKATGLFYVHPERINDLSPMIVSAMYYKEENARRFENYNTRDVPGVLGLGVAAEYQKMIGPQRVHRRILELKDYLRQRVAESPGLRFKSPASDALTAGITAVEVVGADVRAVAKYLDEQHGINCRPMSGPGLNALRISTAVYNSFDQIEQLIAALSAYTS